MVTSQVIALLLSDNPLKIGYDTAGQPVLGLDGWKEIVAGKPVFFKYLNEKGDPEMFNIEGQRTFDLSNEIDKRNWNTLRADMAMHPDLKNQIKLINPQEDAENEIKAAKRLKKLLDILMDHEVDGEWLAKVYRRIVGHAGGLTTQVLFRALWEKAKTEPDKFGVKNWIFESEFFETESLLDLATERGVIIRDGDFYKKMGETTPFADTRGKAIFYLNTEAAYKNHLLNAVSAKVLDKEPDQEWTVEANEEMMELINSVGEVGELSKANADGSFDNSGDDDKRQIEFETIVQTLVEGGLLIEDANGMISSSQFNLTNMSKQELVGLLKGQPALFEEFKTYAA